MTTYDSLNAQISETIRSQGELSPLKNEWSEKIKKLDAFIQMFLDRFGDRVLGDKDNSPEWKLYSEKTAEYSNYSRALRNVEYFLAKERINGK